MGGRDLDEAKSTDLAIARQIMALDKEIDTLNNEKNVQYDRLTLCKKETMGQSRAVQLISREITDLNQSGPRLDQIYGRGYQAFVNKVDSSKRSFLKPPIGPLSNYIKVQKQWMPVIEKKVLGQYVMSWIVCCESDKQKLFQIAKAQ